MLSKDPAYSRGNDKPEYDTLISVATPVTSEGTTLRYTLLSRLM